MDDKVKILRYMKDVANNSDRPAIAAREKALNSLKPAFKQIILGKEKENRIKFSADFISNFKGEAKITKRLNREIKKLSKIRKDPAVQNSYRKLIDAEEKASKAASKAGKKAAQFSGKQATLAAILDNLPGAENFSRGDFGDSIANRYTSEASLDRWIDNFSGPKGEEIRDALEYSDPKIQRKLIEDLGTNEQPRFDEFYSRARRLNSASADLTGADQWSRMEDEGLIKDRPAFLSDKMIGHREATNAKNLGKVARGADTSFEEDALYDDHNKWVRQQYENLDPSWHNEFTDVTVPENTSVSKKSADRGLLTKADLWLLKTRVHFGHLGASAQPGYQYARNWLSNISPESEFDNLRSKDNMTLAGLLNTDAILSENAGHAWHPENLRVIREQIADAGLENASRNVGLLVEPESSIPIQYDAHQDAIDSKVMSPFQGLALFGGRRGTPSGTYPGSGLNDAPPRDVALRGVLEDSLVNFDSKSQAASRAGKAMRARYPEQFEKARTLNETQRQSFKSAITEQLKEIKRGDFRNMPSVPQILDRAARSLGKGVLGIAPMALFLADPELAQAYDEISILEGEELYTALGKKLGVDEYMTSANQAITSGLERGKSGQYGTGNAIKSAAGQFGYETAKAIFTELPGLVSSAAKAPVAPAGNISWAEQMRKEYQARTGLPENVLATQPKPKAWKKYGGSLQPRY